MTLGHHPFLIITSTTDFFGTIFTAKEKPEYPAMVIIVSMTLNVILNYFLILRVGMIGAAVAMVISTYFNFFSLSILSKRVLDIFPNLSSIYKPLISSFVMVLFLYFMPRPDTVLIGILEILIAGTVYLTVLILLRGIGRENLGHIKEIFVI